MVFGMMEDHDLLDDVGFESIVGVWERRELL